MRICINIIAGLQDLLPKTILVSLFTINFGDLLTRYKLLKSEADFEVNDGFCCARPS